jgi:hypothetical protein
MSFVNSNRSSVQDQVSPSGVDQSAHSTSPEHTATMVSLNTQQRWSGGKLFLKRLEQTMRRLFKIGSDRHDIGKVSFSWHPEGNFIASAGANGLIPFSAILITLRNYSNH